MAIAAAWITPRAGSARLALVLAAIILLGGSAAQAEYRLEQGDEVRLVIAGVPRSETTSTVDLDGHVRFPRLGVFDADGRTLAELRDAISVAAAGVVVQALSGNGQQTEIALDGTEVFVEISAYRPVYVSGDVAAPGEVAFRPGLTVRKAIASAGGASAVPDRFQSAALDTPDLRAKIRSLSLTHASAVIRRWGIDALLARNLDQPRPDPARLAVSKGVFENMLASERDVVGNALAEHRSQRAATRERLELLSSRLTRLSEKLDNQQSTLELEDKDLERAKDLRERGLTPETRVSDARRSLLLASTRILGVQDSIARLELQKQELEQELAASEKEFETPLMKERQDVSEAIRTTASQLAAARDSLELYGLAARGAGASDITVELVRRVDGEAKTLTPDPDTRIMPGDVVEVTLRHELPDALVGLSGSSEYRSRNPASQERQPDASASASSLLDPHRPSDVDLGSSARNGQLEPSVTASGADKEQ